MNTGTTTRSNFNNERDNLGHSKSGIWRSSHYRIDPQRMIRLVILGVLAGSVFLFGLT